MALEDSRRGGALRRVAEDVRRQRHLEWYAMSAASMAFAALSAFGDALPVDLRWSLCIAGIGMLLYRTTVPAAAGPAGTAPADRGRFVQEPVAPLLESAHEVWMYAPSGKNFLSSEHCALLARVLRRPEGVVRCVVLDPARTGPVGIAAAQLRCARTLEPLPEALSSALERLRAIASWDLPGEFSCQLLDYNPGFSMIAIDPSRGGPVFVELHGVRNESSSDRMHLVFTADEQPAWHAYWVEQFSGIWDSSIPHLQR